VVVSSSARISPLLGSTAGWSCRQLRRDFRKTELAGVNIGMDEHLEVGEASPALRRRD
jgi:hypothetical protein